MSREGIEAILRRLGLGALVVIPALALSPVMAEGFRAPKLVAGGLAVALSLLAGSLALPGRRTKFEVVDALWWLPAILAGVALALSPAPSPGGTAEVARLAVLAGVFLVARRWGTPGTVAGWAALALCLNALAAFAQAAGFRSSWWVPWQGRHAVYGTFGNPNFLAEYCAPVLVLSVAWCLSARDRMRSLPWGIAAVAAALVLFLTVSRAAWLGVVVGLLLAAVLGAFRGPDRVLRGAVLGVAVLLAGLFLWKPVWTRLGSSLDGNEPGLATRVFMWKAAGRMFGSAPVWGAGPGAFSDRYLDESARMYAEGTPPPPYAGITQEAHSEPLQLLAERGMAGAAVWILALVFTVGAARRTAEGPGGGAVWGALGAVAVTALFGFPMRVVPTAILFFALLGSVAPVSPAARAVPGLFVAVPGMVLACLLAFPAARTLVSSVSVGLAREDAVAERMLGKALAIDPSSGEARFRMGRELIRQGRMDEAASEFEAALATHRDPDTWFNLGWLALQRREYGVAARWFNEGLRRYPRYKARPWADLATALGGMGMRREARDAALRALEIDPGEPTARAIMLGKGGHRGR